MQYPAAIPAVALAAGISIGIFAGPPLHPSVPLFIWTAALGAFVMRRDGLTTALLVLGFTSCGAILGSEADRRSRATSLGTFFNTYAAAGQHQLFGTITGRLRADAVRGTSGLTLNLHLESVALDGVVHAVSGGALIGVAGALGGEDISRWRSGRRLAFPATLRRPTRYLNPGVADAERQFAWRDIALVGSVKSDRLVTIIASGNRVEEAAAAVRAAVRRAIDVSVAPWGQRSAAVVTAILIGDRAGLDESVERKLQEAGTYHVIAISGGNIAILAALCLFLFRVLRFGPGFAGVLIIAILSAYAVLVEGGSSVARATLMAAIYFSARLWDHQTSAVNVLALTAATLLCVHPLQLVDAGFALTFGATAGIVIGMSRFAEVSSVPGWIQPAAALLGATLCAEIVLLPVSAFVFSRVTFAGLLINLAAIPLMTIVQIAGMAAVALAWCASGFATTAGWMAHCAAEALIRSAALVDVAPWLSRRVPPPSLVLVTAYYTSLIAAVVSRRRRMAAIATAAWAAAIVMAPNLAVGASQRPLRVTFLDVGQGDAAIVQFPNGRSLSIDAGGLPGASFDIGGRIVSPALWKLGVRRLDYMSVTHGDDDHIGGAESVFQDFAPAEVWEGVPVPPHKPSQQLRALANRSGTPWRTLQPGDKLGVGEVELLVRHPPHPEWERQRVRNDDSEVIEIRYRDVSFVFTGDIGREVEQQIASSFPPSAIRIMKVPHHGSATSSSQPFLNALRPDIAVISAGRGNTFGHPVASVLERYRNIGAAIYRTDQDGAVTIETDGTTVRVTTFTGRLLTLTTYGRDHEDPRR